MVDVNVNDLVDKIGALLFDIINPPWERVWMEIIQREHSIGLQARLEAKGRDYESVSFFDSFTADETEAIDDAIDELRERFNKAGTPWKKAIFTVTSDGEAKIKFEYDD